MSESGINLQLRVKRCPHVAAGWRQRHKVGILFVRPRWTPKVNKRASVEQVLS